MHDKDSYQLLIVLLVHETLVLTVVPSIHLVLQVLSQLRSIRSTSCYAPAAQLLGSTGTAFRELSRQLYAVRHSGPEALQLATELVSILLASELGRL